MQKSFVLILVALFFVQFGVFIQNNNRTEANESVTVSSDNNSYSFSDRNLKKNIREITDPIGKLNKLNGYYYQWKQDDDQSTLEYNLEAKVRELEK